MESSSQGVTCIMSPVCQSVLFSSHYCLPLSSEAQDLCQSKFWTSIFLFCTCYYLLASVFKISLFSSCSHGKTEGNYRVWLRGRWGQGLALSTPGTLVITSKLFLVGKEQRALVAMFGFVYFICSPCLECQRLRPYGEQCILTAQQNYSGWKPTGHWELCSKLGAFDSSFFSHQQDWPFNRQAEAERANC